MNTKKSIVTLLIEVHHNKSISNLEIENDLIKTLRSRNNPKIFIRTIKKTITREISD